MKFFVVLLFVIGGAVCIQREIDIQESLEIDDSDSSSEEDVGPVFLPIGIPRPPITVREILYLRILVALQAIQRKHCQASGGGSVTHGPSTESPSSITPITAVPSSEQPTTGIPTTGVSDIDISSTQPPTGVPSTDVSNIDISSAQPSTGVPITA